MFLGRVLKLIAIVIAAAVASRRHTRFSADEIARCSPTMPITCISEILLKTVSFSQATGSGNFAP
jgi:hypothetical protein